jgi:L-amino acid N-acyltransferase YncA
MNISFEPMSEEHRIPIMDIYNYYIENSFSAYPDKAFNYDFYNRFIENTKGYPAYAIKVEEKVVGFCYLSAYNPLSSFRETAQITYFISADYKGKGIGKIALKKLEEEAKRIDIKIILAHISSINHESIAFHLRNGFKECGKFEKIIKKRNENFDIIWMQKYI